MEKKFYENGKKKTCIAMLISDETCFKDCNKRQKKENTQWWEVNPRRRYEIINKYAPNRGTPKHIKRMLTGKKQVEACSQSAHLPPPPPHPSPRAAIGSFSVPLTLLLFCYACSPVLFIILLYRRGGSVWGFVLFPHASYSPHTGLYLQFPAL